MTDDEYRAEFARIISAENLDEVPLFVSSPGEFDQSEMHPFARHRLWAHELYRRRRDGGTGDST